MKPRRACQTSVVSQKFVHDCGERFFAQARRARRASPLWGCEERPTKPARKRAAAQRVAPKWARGGVARRSQIRADMLPPRALPHAHFRRNNHQPIFCDTTLERTLMAQRLWDGDLPEAKQGVPALCIKAR